MFPASRWSTPRLLWASRHPGHTASTGSYLRGMQRAGAGADLVGAGLTVAGWASCCWGVCAPPAPPPHPSTPPGHIASHEDGPVHLPGLRHAQVVQRLGLPGSHRQRPLVGSHPLRRPPRHLQRRAPLRQPGWHGPPRSWGRQTGRAPGLRAPPPSRPCSRREGRGRFNFTDCMPWPFTLGPHAPGMAGSPLPPAECGPREATATSDTAGEPAAAAAGRRAVPQPPPPIPTPAVVPRRRLYIPPLHCRYPEVVVGGCVPRPYSQGRPVVVLPPPLPGQLLPRAQVAVDRR